MAWTATNVSIMLCSLPRRSVLSIREAKLGPGHEDILLSLSALAQVMEELGELEEAGATYAQLAAHVQSEGSSKPQWAVPVMIRWT